MASPQQQLLCRILRIGLSLMPWAGAAWLNYWLEYEGVWAVDMPHRALASAVILGVGMGLSFLLYTRLRRV